MMTLVGLFAMLAVPTHGGPEILARHLSCQKKRKSRRAERRATIVSSNSFLADAKNSAIVAEVVLGPFQERFYACYVTKTGSGFVAYAKVHESQCDSAWEDGAIAKIASPNLASPNLALLVAIARAESWTEQITGVDSEWLLSTADPLVYSAGTVQEEEVT